VGGDIGGKMIKQQFEKEIRDLQKELAELQMEKATLHLQPCWGDAEIRKKETKFDELDSRAKTIDETLRYLTRKHQLSIFGSTTRITYVSPRSDDPS
jgi:hypothetical protein